MEKIRKNYLNELQNPPVNSKDTGEDISKVVKLIGILQNVLFHYMNASLGRLRHGNTHIFDFQTFITPFKSK